MPPTGTVFGDPAALWAMLTAAVFTPVVVGLNVTVMVQVPAGATAAAQPFVTVNCDRSAPVSVTPVTERLALPLLVTVMFCAAERDSGGHRAEGQRGRCHCRHRSGSGCSSGRRNRQREAVRDLTDIASRVIPHEQAPGSIRQRSIEYRKVSRIGRRWRRCRERIGSSVVIGWGSNRWCWLLPVLWGIAAAAASRSAWCR